MWPVVMAVARYVTRVLDLASACLTAIPATTQGVTERIQDTSHGSRPGGGKHEADFKFNGVRTTLRREAECSWDYKRATRGVLVLRFKRWRGKGYV